MPPGSAIARSRRAGICTHACEIGIESAGSGRHASNSLFQLNEPPSAAALSQRTAGLPRRVAQLSNEGAWPAVEAGVLADVYARAHPVRGLGATRAVSMTIPSGPSE